MKFLFINIVLLVTLLFSFPSYSQHQGRIDSLKNVLGEQKADSNRVRSLYLLSQNYRLYYPDSSLTYAYQALELSKAIDYQEGIFWSMTAICAASTAVGNYPLELEYAFKAFALSKKLGTPRILGFGNGVLSDCYYNLGEYDTSRRYWFEVMKIIGKWFPEENYVAWANLSRIYVGMKQSDSAMLYAKKAHEMIKEDQRRNRYWHPRQESLIYTCLGDAFASKSEHDSALFYYRRSISLSANNSWEIQLFDGYNGMAAVHKHLGGLDSAIWYANKIVETRLATSYPISGLTAANILSEIYESRNRPDSSLKYLRMAIGLRDSLFNREKMMAIQNLKYKELEKRNELADSRLKSRNQTRMFILLAAFIAVLVTVSILLRNQKQRQLQRMRNRIADDLHDDIGSTLSSINILSELAKKKSPEAIALLDSIGENTLSIQENMSDIVWSLNAKSDHLEEVLQRMRQFAGEIFEGKNIELDFSYEPSLSASRMTMTERKNFYLFFKEVVNNAAKHSEARKVTIRICQRKQGVEMTITDNGKGLDTTKVYSGNGMSTLRKRAEDLHGSFTIQSRPNEGTTVRLMI